MSNSEKRKDKERKGCYLFSFNPLYTAVSYFHMLSEGDLLNSVLLI